MLLKWWKWNIHWSYNFPFKPFSCNYYLLSCLGKILWLDWCIQLFSPAQLTSRENGNNSFGTVFIDIFFWLIVLFKFEYISIVQHSLLFSLKLSFKHFKQELCPHGRVTGLKIASQQAKHSNSSLTASIHLSFLSFKDFNSFHFLALAIPWLINCKTSRFWKFCPGWLCSSWLG